MQAGKDNGFSGVDIALAGELSVICDALEADLRELVSGVGTEA